LGVDESIEVKAEAQRVVDGQKGVVQAFKPLANARNLEYEHVSKLSYGGKQNSQKKRKI
jgi:hypothetical protein